MTDRSIAASPTHPTPKPPAQPVVHSSKTQAPAPPELASTPPAAPPEVESTAAAATPVNPAVRSWLPIFGAGAGLVAGAVILGLRGSSTPPRALPLPHPPAIATSATSAPATSAPTVPAPTAQLAEQATPPRFAEALDVSVFQKGNIHTHTTFSDGDRPPQDVYAWYRDRGYNFLAITDHNTLTNPAKYKLLERKRFVMITGEEITMRGAGKQVHVNAICTKSTIGGGHFDTQGQALAWAVKQVEAQGGVSLVNHPNWDWALTAADLPSAEGAELLEIASGHPYVHTMGDETHLSHEAIWDKVLTAGQTFAGVAVDDAHIYGSNAPENAARPGRAWIQVFASEASRDEICGAIHRGRLYASTGATLKRIAVKDDTYTVWTSDAGADVEFIGKDGAALASVKPGGDGSASYTLHGGEGYVRARISLPGGKHAWTQPSRLATVAR